MQIKHKSSWVAAGASMIIGLALALPASADPFTQEDVKNYMDEYMAVVKKGDDLSHGGIKGNGVACAQCHPNGANMHPETYPKFQKQLGKVAQFYEMINWCIENPVEGQALAPDSEDMIAVIAYNTWERRGVPLAPGKH